MGSGGSADFGGSEAATAAGQVAQGWSNSDYEALNKLFCPGSEAALHGFATDAPHVTQFEVTSGLQERRNPPSASFLAKITVENKGEQVSVEAELTVAPGRGAASIEDA